MGLDDEQRIHLKNVLASGDKLKTSDLLCCYYPEELAPLEGNDRNKTPNKHLSDLASLGLVAYEQNDGRKGGKGDGGEPAAVHHGAAP